MAVLPSYDSFFSSYSRKPEKGYSGTCIFTKRSTTVPIKAEEGISGLLPLDRRPEPTPDEFIGGILSPESIALNMQDVKIIDLEGRTTMLDLGLFVLINLYCPNETNEDRLDFKLAFNAMLEARILNLIKAGRQVVAVGDMNISARPIDHCDPVRRASESAYGGYDHHPARKWFNEFIGQRGSMIDLGRHFHPERKSMFTHWETRINARETNYGTRIDYILATPGLLPWIKTCEIMPHILGSDHCPVVADFHDSITTAQGSVLHLRDYINPPERSKSSDAAPPEPPKLAAKFYPEFSSEQRLLSNFFGKRAAGISTPPPISTNHATSPSTTREEARHRDKSSASDALDEAQLTTVAVPAEKFPLFTASSSQQSTQLPPGLPVSGAPVCQSPSIDLTLNNTDDSSDEEQKRTIASTSRSPSVTELSNGTAQFSRKKAKKGQQTLAGFLKPPPLAVANSNGGKSDKKEKKDKGKGKMVYETVLGKAFSGSQSQRMVTEKESDSEAMKPNGVQDDESSFGKVTKGSPGGLHSAEEDLLRAVRRLNSDLRYSKQS